MTMGSVFDWVLRVFNSNPILMVKVWNFIKWVWKGLGFQISIPVSVWVLHLGSQTHSNYAFKSLKPLLLILFTQTNRIL